MVIALWVGEITSNGYQDVEFLPSLTSFSTTFLRNGVRGESLRTATCPKTVVEDNQGHTLSEI